MRLIFIGFVVCIFAACGEDTPSDNCKYGEPVPIFTDSLDQIQKHRFLQKGQRAVEELVFADRTRLEIFQSGCNEIRQEFRFYGPAPPQDITDSLWFDAARQRMSYLSSLGEQYMSLGMTGQIIATYQNDMQLGNFKNIDLDTYILVDRMVEAEEAMIIVVLEKRS